MAKILGQLQNAQLENLTADPASLPDGRIWIDTATDKAKFYDGAAVRTVTDTNSAQTLTNKTIDADSNTVSNIDNDNIKAAAAIAHSKMAALTASRAMVTDGSGVAAVSAATATEVGYLSGVSSAIQTQIDNHLADTTTHGTTGAIVGTTDTQTLTNKTLAFLRTSVANDTATGSNATITTITSGTVRLTDASLVSVDEITAGVSSQVLIVENKTGATITIVNENTLSTTPENRINTGAGDVSMPDDATFIFTYDATDARWMLTGGSGSGSGSSGINYIEAPDGEAGDTGWTEYADAAGSSPVDGTGGSPTVVFGTSIVGTILRGTKNLVLSKGAASDKQGQGVAYDFTIDNADKSKILQISFDYIVKSGTFTAGSSTTDSDVTVWIYDVGNSRLIQPSTYKLFSNSTTVADRYISNFQTSADSTEYRLILHLSNSNANDWDLAIDNVVVSPTTIAFGTPITDWKDAGALVITGTTSDPTPGTTTTNKMMWRRVGQNAEITMTYVQTGAGAAGSGDYLFQIPTGLSIDTTKLTAYTTVEGSGLWSAANNVGTVIGNQTAVWIGNVVVYDSTKVRFALLLDNAGSSGEGYASSGRCPLSTAATVFCAQMSVPIAGWSSQVQTSDVSDQRIVAARYDMVAGATSTANNPINFATKSFDTHNAVTTGVNAWKFTAPVSGVYELTASAYFGANIERLAVYKNGSVDCHFAHHNTSHPAAGSAIVSLNAGDYIDLRSDSATTSATTGSGHDGYIAVKRIANPALISATETIAARYYTTTAQNVDAAGTVIQYNTKDFDTHNAFSTSTYRFTAPAAGLYSVNAAIQNASITSTAVLDLGLYKNGALHAGKYESVDAAVQRKANPVISALVQMNAGDYLEVQMIDNINVALSGVAAYNYFNIHRIGL